MNYLDIVIYKITFCIDKLLYTIVPSYILIINHLIVTRLQLKIIKMQLAPMSNFIDLITSYIVLSLIIIFILWNINQLLSHIIFQYTNNAILKKIFWCNKCTCREESGFYRKHT